MKETNKTSISGYVFTLESDAYNVLNTYMDELKAYFADKEDGTETLKDIEDRMSELLQLKIDKVNNLVTVSDAKHIIEIMGTPQQFDELAAKTDKEESNITSANKANKEGSENISKKIYRDKSDSILGGVCSGLAKYFNIDTTLLRLGYIAIIIVAWAISHRFGFTLFALYFILWIIVPSAKTFKQKLAMSGQNPSIKDVESENLKIKSPRGNAIGKKLITILVILLKAFLIIIGTILSLSIIGILIATFIYPTINDVPSLVKFLKIIKFYSTENLISIELIFLIPLFTSIYFIICVIRNFKIKDFWVFGIALLCWIGVCTYLGVKATLYSKNYKYEKNAIEKYIPAIKSDTIHIKLDNYYANAGTTTSKSPLYFIDDETREWIIMPNIQVNKDSIYQNVEIIINKKAFDKHAALAQEKAEKASVDIYEDSSTVFISPHVYSTNKPWDREFFEITVNSPVDKTIITDPRLRTY